MEVGMQDKNGMKLPTLCSYDAMGISKKINKSN
jgi:hypothetical protein